MDGRPTEQNPTPRSKTSLRQIRQRRKNFLPTLIVNLLAWAGWLFVLLKIRPEQDWQVVVFLLLLFLAVFLSTALILANTRRGFLLAALIALTLLFFTLEIGTPLNIGLLISLFATIEIYASKH